MTVFLLDTTLKCTPGTWVPTRADDGHRSAVIVCPDCQQPVTLHRIDIEPTGMVPMVVKCPYDACPFHDSLRLEGWGKVATA